MTIFWTNQPWITFLATFCVFKLGSCLTCLSCDQISQPRHCRYVETCNKDEICATQMQLSVSGYYTYTLGCMPNSKCRNATASLFCSECCSNKNLCNAALCGEPDFPVKRGPICFDCQFYTDAQPCRHIDFCSEHEDCSILGIEEFGDLMLRSACKPKHVCLASSIPYIGKRNVNHMTPDGHVSFEGRVRSASHVICEECCSQDLCNLGCPGICGSSTCVNGNCSSTSSGNKCVCQPGWGGARCDQGSSLINVTKIPQDCSELSLPTPRNGSYTIFPYGSLQTGVSVYCEFHSDGIWTVIQKRFDGSVDFYKNWGTYKKGFGTSTGEHWLGNDIIHHLTSSQSYKLKIVLKDWSAITKYAKYSTFSIAGESDYYRLTVQGYTGDAGDCMITKTAGGPHNGQKFSTFDADHDMQSSNCAVEFHGAWWYHNCYDSNLNGQYHQTSGITQWKGIVWNTWHGSSYSLKGTEMMIQRN